MNSLDALLTGLGASIVSSGVIGFAVKTYLEASIRQRFAAETELLRQQLLTETEKLRASLTLWQESEHEINERRLKAYPQLTELVYRIKNAAQDAMRDNTTSFRVRAEDFHSRVQALEDSLYGYRIYLQRDNVFPSVHAFKNAAKNFGLVLTDISLALVRQEPERIAELRARLADTFPQLDESCGDVVVRLAGLIARDL